MTVWSDRPIRMLITAPFEMLVSAGAPVGLDTWMSLTGYSRIWSLRPDWADAAGWEANSTGMVR